jgi:hypothetical protein
MGSENLQLERLSKLAAVLIIIILAYGFHRFVERPIGIRNGTIRRGNSGRKRAITFMLAAMLVFIFVGAAIYASSGVPSRFSNEVIKIAGEVPPELNIKSGKCFLKGSTATKFSDECLPPKSEDNASKYVLIWGDSYAAHLFPGVMSLGSFGKALDVAQFTISSCPPILSQAIRFSASCMRQNDYIALKIKQVLPDVVILAAHWLSYDHRGLVSTLKFLNDIGVRRVIVVGPFPEWKGSLPRNIYFSGPGNPRFELPTRLSTGLVAQEDIEVSLRYISSMYDATYVSPLGLLCNEGGCLVVVGDSSQELTSYDAGHPTIGTSKYVSRILLAPLIFNSTISSP